jgi:hypothetical protein
MEQKLLLSPDTVAPCDSATNVCAPDNAYVERRSDTLEGTAAACVAGQEGPLTLDTGHKTPHRLTWGRTILS